MESTVEEFFFLSLSIVFIERCLLIVTGLEVERTVGKVSFLFEGSDTVISCVRTSSGN